MDLPVLPSSTVPSNAGRSRTPKRPSVARNSAAAQSLDYSSSSLPVLASQRHPQTPPPTRFLASQPNALQPHHHRIVSLVDDEEISPHVFDSASQGSDDFSEFTLNDNTEGATDDIDSLFEETDMTSRQQRPPIPPQPLQAYTIDLTMDSSPPQPSRKRPGSVRSRSAAADAAGPSKRQRQSSGSPSRRRQDTQHQEKPLAHIDQIDLCDDDNNDLAVALQRQRADAVAAQQAASHQSTKLSELTCTVCLDDVQQLTVTTCGHAFCRKCLLDWLKAGEREQPKRSNCPACRKTLSRNRKNDIIHMEIMTRPRKVAAPRQPP